RADALGALAAGAQRLVCGCGNADCPVDMDGTERSSGVVIHVVAEESAVTTQLDRHLSGEPKPCPITPDEPLVRPPDPEPDVPTVKSPPAVLTSGGVIPPALLAELIRTGATLQPVCHPGNVVQAEAGYRPSAALERFVRCRDMTCRFPNCDRPAEFCDVDHTVPYHAGGLTHPSNLKCLCRKHHLLKTFWTAWRDRQLPDGTVVWTAPTGQTYITRPGSRLLFPTLSLTTGELPAAPTVQLPADRGLMMPMRRRTREQDRARRIEAERALNNDHVAERNRPPPF
ncbi:MAG TPA: DUF222 domain-containing protein, partial [Mycobacterium sp.]|uniref:HNH endonuclease signature motif containing protein n=1 Tax=Mycobacterium sp. TaxID=1785 RepID=UPI002D44A6A3